MTREQALVAAAEKFVAKVESGRARSRETYAEMKAALAMAPRTCAGCNSRHKTTGGCYKDVQDPEGEEVTNTMSPWSWRNRDTFGCSEWKAREGEGGEG